MTMIIIWWVVSAHKWFKGPKVKHIISNLVFSRSILLTDVTRSTSSIKCLAVKASSLTARSMTAVTRALGV